jgi:hypothetical protein
MDKNEVIAGLAGDLYAAEAAVDEAIVKATTLVQAMIAARTELSVAATVGAGAQAKAMESLAALGQAREAVTAAHTEMARDHRRMGWGVYAAGPVNKPPEDGRPIEIYDQAPSPAAARLRAV